MKAEQIRKVHCLFEQSGTFKNEFIKLGIPAEDYDIQNNFNQTDHVIDLFAEIEKAYERRTQNAEVCSIFDTMSSNDLIIAFFPCIHFCDAKTMLFKGVHIAQKNWTLEQIMQKNIENAKTRELFFERLMQLVYICSNDNLKLVIENPWNTSRETYLQCNFIPPTIIDTNRSLRGDYFVKPTAYWFINLEHTNGQSIQRDKEIKIVYKQRDKKQVTGLCSEERSLISPDYARNFICDFILGKQQKCIAQQQFEFD